MRLQPPQIDRLVHDIIDRLKQKNLIQFKAQEKDVFAKAIELVVADFKREDDLVKEVYRMMDDLEKQNPGGFERHKMFPLLKQRLAKQKGIVL